MPGNKPTPFDTCFNPWKLERHAPKDRKKLRKMSPMLLQKLKIPITPTTSLLFICDACRIRVTKIRKADENGGHNTPSRSSVGNMKSVVTANTSAAVSTENYLDLSLVPVRREGIMNLNKSLITLGGLPVIKRTLDVQENCSPEKLRKIDETMDKKLSKSEDDDKKDGTHTGNDLVRLCYTFRGHMAPTLTPFLNDSTRSLNLSIIPQYAEFLADRGVTGVLVNGTSGEGPSMTVGERRTVAETWARAVKSTKQHLMIQVGGTALPNVLELAKHAENIGVDSLLCLPELYFKPTTPKQLVEYLRLVGQAAPKTPLLYYHIPMFTNVNINMPQFLESVGDRIPSLVGIKFSSANLEEATQVFHVNNKEFVIFLGNDQILAGGFAQGMNSAITTTMNMLPEIGVGILKASASGDMAKARELQEKLAIASKAISKYGTRVETMKAAMGLLTPFDVGPPRAPMNPLSAESIALMKQGLKDLRYQVLR